MEAIKLPEILIWSKILELLKEISKGMCSLRDGEIT